MLRTLNRRRYGGWGGGGGGGQGAYTFNLLNKATSTALITSGKEKENLEREVQKIKLENQTKIVQSNEQLQKMKIE